MLYNEKWDVKPVIESKPLELWRQRLLGAAQILRTSGWCQKHYYVGETSCLVGAIRRSCQTAIGAQEPLNMVKDFLGYSPVVWNDMSGRTKEQVINLLETVAKKGL